MQITLNLPSSTQTITLVLLVSCVVKYVCGQSVFNSQANEVNYLLDDAATADKFQLIKFVPESLKFDQHSIGIPVVEKVTVKNLQDSNNIMLLSISGNSLHFHCSFFDDKILQPQGNTSFEVVFLARREGSVNNTLFIHTSIGTFKYQVSATGTSNPFRLRPFVGAKLPINSSYSPLIHIYNPRNSTLQLTEMYSTGGGLHLELPNGNAETPQNAWQVPPYETKTIMRANFLARSERNHTAFIRIKTNDSVEEAMILPVEVEVSSAPGIYSTVDLLNFGYMRSHDEPKTIAIQVLNSGTKYIQIQNVIATPVNEALNIEFEAPIRVAPDIYHSVDIAKVTLNPAKIITCSKQCSGKIVVKSKNNQYKLAIPYQVNLLQGNLNYNKSLTQFYIQSDSITEKRTLSVSNNFDFPVIFHSITFPEEAKTYFKVGLSSTSITLPRNASVNAIKIEFTPASNLMHLETKFRIHTNISHFDVPLIAYSGKLQVFIPQTINQTILDFGAIGIGEKKSMTFALVNNNPIVVRLKHWGCNMSKTYVELVGIGEGNVTVVIQRNDFSSLSRKNITLLKPKHYAIFKLHITGIQEEGLFYGENFVETAFERLQIPFALRAVQGNINIEEISLPNCFPGRISSQTIRVASTFTHELSLRNIRIIPEDKRYYFELEKLFINFGDNFIGKLYFDPSKSCGRVCYSGLETSKEVGHLWLLGLSLHPDTGYIDKELHKLLYTRWTNMHQNEKSFNSTLRLHVDGISSLEVFVATKLQWPRLVHKNLLKFPISKVGNTTQRELIIDNPSSSHMIIVQLVMLSDYPNSDAIFQLIKSGFHINWNENELNSFEKKRKSFLLANLTSSENNLNHKLVKDMLGVIPDPNSLTFLMPSGSRKRISISFIPQDDSSVASTMLLIRNNLTILEAVHLQGQGGRGLLKIGNQTPGLKSVLFFELLEKHLKSCSKTKTLHSTNTLPIEPTFTVHRTFTAVNVGKLPMRIIGFKIGPQDGSSTFSCQGYGFKVINCAPFDLRPNENKKIHIAFTPDFTQSKVRQFLTVLTDDTKENLQFALVASLPRNLLLQCNNSIPRPNWEAVLYYCLVTMMFFMILLAICVAFFDGDRILNYSFYPVLTSYSTSFCEKALITSEESSEKNLKTNQFDEKDSKRQNELRQRKLNQNQKSKVTSKITEPINKEDLTSSYQSQTWAQFLKRKLVRRDSSGSDKSNNSMRGPQYYQKIQLNQFGLKKESLNDEKGKNKSKKNQKLEKSNEIGKKRLNAPLKFENLTNVISSPPPPLPSFPSSFDDDFVKNLKSIKKPKSNAPVHNEAESNNLELPYKPTKSNLNVATKQSKKPRPKEKNNDDNDSYTSSNENSAVWDSPISTFDSDNAMDEIVRQTELFAETTQKCSKNNLQSFETLDTNLSGLNHPFIGSKLHLESKHQKTKNTQPTSWSQPNLIPQVAVNYSKSSTAKSDRLLPSQTSSKFIELQEKSFSGQDWYSENSSNSLDHDLNQLRETSSPWTSQSPLIKQREWSYYNEAEQKKELWDSNKWSSTLSNPKSSQTWDEPPKDLWSDSHQRTENSSWDGNDFTKLKADIALSENANSMESPVTEASLFNLFGRSGDLWRSGSIWSPISNVQNNSTTTQPNTSDTSSTTNPFTSFNPLFGSFNQNNENKPV